MDSGAAATTVLTLPGQETACPIRVGSALLAHLPAFIHEVAAGTQKVLLVTDSIVAPYYLDSVQSALQKGGLKVESIILAAGERQKTMASLETLYDKAVDFDLKRNDMIVALGGGVVGDITGFFASSYQRGIPYIQAPTTLLAQVDAAIGGKVAVNREGVKNALGTFYHPRGVLIDVETLKTLPPRQFACGMAEVIKYSFLQWSVPGQPVQENMFLLLQDHINTLETILPQVILYCCQLKAAVVQADPEERHGVREILNLGHTFGHAYETLSEGRIHHGEAVSMGMVHAFQLATALEGLSSDLLYQVKSLLLSYHLPIVPPIAFSPQAMVEVMMRDKKNRQSGRLRLVLPENDVGYVCIRENIPQEAVRIVLMGDKI